MPTFGEVGSYSTTIPDLESTGNLTVEFSRNPNSFPLNKYSELRPVTSDYGFFLKIDPTQASRVSTNGAEFAWPKGANRPTGNDNRSMFELDFYRTQRFAPTVPLDTLSVQMATWDVTGVEQRKLGTQLMTLRTQSALTVLANASWGSVNTSSIANIPYNGSTIGSGHNWGNGTVSNPWIQVSLQFAAQQIKLATNGVIQPNELVLVVDVPLAIAMSQSPEVKGMLANSVYAYPQIMGTLPDPTKGREYNWGLPPQLYSVPLVVEDTVVTTSNKGASSVAQSFALGSGNAFMLCRRDGELVTPAVLAAERRGETMDEKALQAVPVYSTLIGFFLEEMTSEQRVDSWNRVQEQSIATNYQYKVSSTLSGFAFTGCLS